ncbi:MAG: baseplate J/gp47 family protein [Roseitalea sp.]|nr:baseplate J/gp47 family protein [Roseitalea sp.]MBO6950981.1 baseplate J/gp47 family protein [Rhizobiaceae bacterium]MBO6591032.1 baseplate J/gp47 family protein [Roseitalea sp.]MBO6599710.1 baseplate J/gp47 family protein [Roseitalea sp.]MBO6611466.1 baseplate J/gp47 family protein [Roseitalea sp.]
MSRFADIDLSRLPAPQVVKLLSYEAQLAEMKAEMITLGDEIGLDLRTALENEADPVLKLLQAFCSRERHVRGDMNDQAKAVMPAFAIGADLDHMAARNGVARKLVAPADDTTTPPTPAIMESDQELRARMQLALEAFSTAGPGGAYLFHALAVEGVKDAAIYGHEDGIVAADLLPADVLAVIVATGETGQADAALVETVRAAISADDKRPLADRVFVEAAAIVDYQIDLEMRVLAGPDAAIAERMARDALAIYTDERFRIGVAHRRTGIGAAAHINGAVEEVIIAAPAADVLPGYNEAARCTAIDVTVTQVSGGWNG